MLASQHRVPRRRKRQRRTLVKKPVEEIEIPPTLPAEVTQNKPKIKRDVLDQELTVRKALKKLKKYQQNLSIDEQIDFFISEHSPQKTGLKTNKNDDNDMQSDQTPPSTSRTAINKIDDPQLASSYVRMDDENAIVMSKKQKHPYADKEFHYYPSANITEEDVKGLQIPIADGYSGMSASKHISKANMNRMIYRFVTENALSWLNGIYEITSLMKLIPNDVFYKVYSDKKFIPIPFIGVPIHSISSSTDSILRIHIQDVCLNHHEMFTEEELIEKNIENLYEQYKERKSKRIVVNLEMELSSLRQQLVDNTNNIVTDSYTQRNDIRNRIYDESRKDKELIKDILDQWKRLKEVRKNQNFNSTTIKLRIKLKHLDFDEDVKNWERKFNLDLIEMYDETCHRSGIHRSKSKSRKSLKNKNLPVIDSMRQTLNEIYEKSIRKPGEPIIDIDLDRLDSWKEAKLSGRNDYFVKLFLDGKMVCRSNRSPIVKGRIVVDTSYSIILIQKVPHEVQVVLFEDQSLKSSIKLVQVFVPIPNSDQLYSKSSPTTLDFSTSIKSSKISGKIKLTIGWNDNTTTENKFNNLKPNMSDTESAIDDLEKAVDERRASTSTMIIEPKSSFIFNEDLLAFCPKSQIDNDVRLNMLIARYNRDTKYKNEKFVPQSHREINQVEKIKIFEELYWMDPIDIQRHNGRKSFLEIYRNIVSYCETVPIAYQSHDLLIGDDPLTLRSIFENLRYLFGPKRPLNPTKRLKPIHHRSCTMKGQLSNFNIFLSIIRATGIPYRHIEQNPSTRRSSVLSSAQQSLRTLLVRPYVTATFKTKTLRTSTADGSNPTWNEQIVIPIKGDELPVKDDLCIKIFDEYIEELNEDDRSRSNEICQRIVPKFLGELRIPFNSFYGEKRIEGTFEVDTPSVLLRYSRPTLSTPDTSIFVDNLPEIRSSMYITLFIGVEPFTPNEKLCTLHLQCTELVDVQTHVLKWYQNIIEEFPARFMDPLVALSNGKRICVTRLIGPINIPFERNSDAEFLIRRFVALIPINYSHNLCCRLNGIWLTNDKIITMLTASPKDLGVLLCCYYLTLEYKTYLVIGHAIPYGETTFVLIKENTNFILIDPHTGRKYSITDTNCPLTKVICLVNQENVWANIQGDAKVFRIRLNVNRTTDWRPLFDRHCKVPIGLVHDQSLEYRKSLPTDDLLKVIEMKIVKKISSWRSDQKTIWNRNIKESLMKILQKLEEEHCYEFDRTNYIDLLSNYLSIYKISGLPINIKYTSLSAIVERIKSTLIHINYDPNVEFSLAVHIYAYPNNVLSLWIFLVSLVPKL